MKNITVVGFVSVAILFFFISACGGSSSGAVSQDAGADADLVIYDPGASNRISAATHESAVDYNAFEGWQTRGRPDVVTVRGRIQVRDGQFIGQQDHGQLLRRPAKTG